MEIVIKVGQQEEPQVTSAVAPVTAATAPDTASAAAEKVEASDAGPAPTALVSARGGLGMTSVRAPVAASGSDAGAAPVLEAHGEPPAHVAQAANQLGHGVSTVALSAGPAPG